MAGISVHDARNRCSASVGIGVHVRPESASRWAGIRTGGRLSVLKEIYQYHYPYQSAQAHGRAAAMAVALLVNNPDSQWNPGHGESDIVATALLCLACILSELEAAGDYPTHPKLLALWTYLRDLGGEARIYGRYVTKSFRSNDGRPIGFHTFVSLNLKHSSLRFTIREVRLDEEIIIQIIVPSARIKSHGLANIAWPCSTNS